MSTKEAYKQKIEAELELAQAKLAEFKAQAKISTADARIKHAKQVEEIERRVRASKAKLKELGETSEGAWEDLKDGVESAWGALSAAIRKPPPSLKIENASASATYQIDHLRICPAERQLMTGTLRSAFPC